jgi:phosphoglucomutase
MSMAIEQARREGAALVLATDPDSDRVGIAVRDEKDEFVLLNGNQTCVLLTYYLLKRWSDLGRLDGKQYVIKTIVTSEMVARVADSFGVEHYNCLTGFKYIAEIIRRNEGKKQYIGGGEESFGYLAGDFVRDKDAVSACALAAEAAAWAKSRGKTLWTLLKEMYVEYGFFREGLVSVVLKGIEGAEQIRQMMRDYRAAPPAHICGSPVVTVRDYLKRRSLDVASGKTTPIEIEESDVLQFLTHDGTIVSVRPSGTEPKIKYYFGVCEPLPSVEKFAEAESRSNDRIARMKKELKLA